MSSTVEECVAGWCATERWCAVACAADVLGRKWHAVIVSRLLEDGPQRFTDIVTDVDGLSDTVLSASLSDLEEKGVVRREIVNDRPLRVEYSLTERGASLEPVLEAMAKWGRVHLDGDD